MGMKKLAAKLDDYQERLESGKASRIKPAHVDKSLRKLRGKSDELARDLAAATEPEKAARLEKKLEVVRAQIARAEWLLREIT